MKRINNLDPFSQDEYDLLQRDYIRDDMQPADMAEQYDVSERLVWRRLKEHGLFKQWGRQVDKPHSSSLYYCPTCGQKTGKQLKTQHSTRRK
ncbi:hypothetical protein BW261_25790 [Klebsiella aerogenes]|nr:hypothetical protein BW261_25790 [Klebsiella aerogenes]